MKERLERLRQSLQRTRAYRAWQRFGDSRGDLLAAGIAYFGFFSIFPAVAIAAIAFGLVLRGRPDLVEAVGQSLNQALPNFVKTSTNPTGVIELKPPSGPALTITGVVAFIGLVLAGVGWIGALREGIRGIFGVEGSAGNVVTAKLRDLGVLATLGTSVLVSAVLTSVIGGAASWLAERIGLGDQPATVAVAGVAVGVVVDVALMVLLLRVMSGVSLPWNDVREAAVIGGVGMSALKLFGGQLVHQATRSPLLGAVVVAVGLLFWLNLMAKLILVSAAWAANDLDADSGRRREAAERQAPDRAGLATPATLAADPRWRAANGVPTFGPRARDRTVIAAGAVLGATAAVAAGAAVRLVRDLVRWR